MKKNVIKKFAALGLSVSLLSALSMTAMAEEQRETTPDLSQYTPEEYESFLISQRGQWEYDDDDIRISDDITDFDEMFNSCPKGYYFMVNNIEVKSEKSYEKAKKIYNEDRWWQVRYCKIDFYHVNSNCPTGYDFYIDNILVDGESIEDAKKIFDEGGWKALKYSISGDSEPSLDFYDISFEYIMKNCPDGYYLYVNNILVKDEQSFEEAKKIYEENKWWQIMYLDEEHEINFDFMMNNCPKGYHFYVNGILVNEENYEEVKKIYEDNEWRSLLYKNDMREIELGSQYKESPADRFTANAVSHTESTSSQSQNAVVEEITKDESTTQDRQSPKTSDVTDAAYIAMLAAAFSIISVGSIARKRVEE